MKKSMIVLWLSTILLIAHPSGAASLRCGHDLVTLGDTKLEVLGKCGEPFWEERHSSELREGVDTSLEKRTWVNIDEWTYNFGRSDFLYFLTFENGRLVNIETGDYGFDPQGRDPRDTCRDGKLLQVGDRTAEVLKKCGTPTTQERWFEERLTPTGPGREEKELFVVEEWTYNFGPHRFIQILRFRNGVLSRIEQGPYGF